MSEPDEDRPDSSDAWWEEAHALPPVARPKDTRSVTGSDGGTDFGKPGGDAESRQITIAELFLVMFIAAVVLGVLRMVPQEFAEPATVMGFAVGLLVLLILRPGRAINYVAWWVVAGFVSAYVAFQPDWDEMRWLLSLAFTLWVANWAFSSQCAAARRAWRPTIRRLWWGLVGLCGVLFVVAVRSVRAWGGHVPWWLPLLVYALATAVALWRVLHPSGTPPSQ